MPLLLQHLTNITINSFIDADNWESRGIATTEQKEEEEAVQWVTNPIVLIEWEGTDGLANTKTQQPTAESN
jgi:hypothetical protein